MTKTIKQTTLAFIAATAAMMIVSVTMFSFPVNAQSLKNSLKCGSDTNLTEKECAASTTEEGKAAKKAQVKKQCLQRGGNEADCEKEANKSSAGRLDSVIKAVINVLSAVAGSIAIIMIIIGGFKYVTSGGESNSVSSAKNTILYAVVGLIIVAFAQVIVQFVLERTA